MGSVGGGRGSLFGGPPRASCAFRRDTAGHGALPTAALWGVYRGGGPCPGISAVYLRTPPYPSLYADVCPNRGRLRPGGGWGEVKWGEGLGGRLGGVSCTGKGDSRVEMAAAAVAALTAAALAVRPLAEGPRPPSPPAQDTSPRAAGGGGKVSAGAASDGGRVDRCPMWPSDPFKLGGAAGRVCATGPWYLAARAGRGGTGPSPSLWRGRRTVRFGTAAAAGRRGCEVAAGGWRWRVGGRDA